MFESYPPQSAIRVLGRAVAVRAGSRAGKPGGYLFERDRICMTQIHRTDGCRHLCAIEEEG